MPLYEYNCTTCNSKFEKLIRSATDAALPRCPDCGSDKTRRLMSVTAPPLASGSKQQTPLPQMCGRCGGAPRSCRMD